MKTIQIPQQVIAAMFRHASDGLPNEVCGLLTGSGGVVNEQYALTNTDHSPEHFSFDPQEQFAVMRAARARGERIIANYHSHPAKPARPSTEDVRLAYDPNIVYIIVSLAGKDPDIKAFSIVDGIVEPIKIIIAFAD